MLEQIALALTVLTGFTGLAYEVTWQKYLGILLGAHSEATAAVLGLFLGGLSLGYWLFGSLTRRLVARGQRSGRPAPLLLVYGAVEAGIGLYCVLFPWLFRAVRGASVMLPMGGEGLGFAVDVLLAAVLILPPATLMGGTVPILTQALARNLEDATRVHALVYGWNTAGAFAGALASGFFLIHWLGFEGILRAMGAINLAVGATFVVLGRQRREVVSLEAPDAPPLRAGLFAVYGTTALLVGFAMMVLQTVAIRVGGLSFGSSEYTFSMVVAVFVLCIARGSFAVSHNKDIGPQTLVGTLWSLAALFTVLYFLLETAPYWAHLVRVIFRDYEAAFYPYYVAVFVLLLVVLSPAVILSGTMLPLLFHALRHEVGDLGSQAGRLYSVNTVGSLLGALLGGYALLFWLDLHHVYRIAVAALVLAAVIVTFHRFPRIRLVGAAALALVSLVGIYELPSWRPEYLYAGLFRERRPNASTLGGPGMLAKRMGRDQYAFYDDDPNTSVAILDTHEPGVGLTRSIYVNGKSDGNTWGDYDTMGMIGLLSTLFVEQPEHAFVIGFGTGVTVGELIELDEIQSVTVAEISPAVIEAAPLFDFANHDASQSPKLRWVRSDAYRALIKSGRSYDVIVSEPSNPWVTGIEMLYSEEFLAAVRDHLEPGGVYCQWFHLYESSTEVARLILKTYASVFEYVAVWSVNSADVMVLGFREPDHALDLARLERRMQRPDFKAGFARLGIDSLPELLAHESMPLGVPRAAALEGPIHTLYRPRLSWEAGRDFFIGRRGSLPFTGYGEAAQVGADNSLLRRYLTAANGKLPSETWAAIATRACDRELPGCGALAAAWSRAEPDSKSLQKMYASWRGDAPRLVSELAGFLDESKNGDERRIEPGDALAKTRLYMANYAHAEPFDPTRLLDVWNRCGSDEDSVEMCQPGVQAARGLVVGHPPPELRDWVRMRPKGAPAKAAHEGDADPDPGEH